MNAISWNCVHCKQKLKASSSTWVLTALSFAAMLAAVAIAILHYDVDIREGKGVLIAVMVPPGLIGTLICFWFGGYDSADR